MWYGIFMDIAEKLATGSKCSKLKVGCLIVKNKRIISSGVNGTPSGYINCCDRYPNGIITEEDKNDHYRWSKLYEIHAEMNAMISASNSGIKIKDADVYVTTFPCTECLKNLTQLGIKNIYFSEFYKSQTYEDTYDSIIYGNENNVRFFIRRDEYSFVIIHKYNLDNFLKNG